MVSPDLRDAPGQERFKISAALENLRKNGFTIHYSAVPLQHIDDGTVSCGIWCLMFLTSKITDFEKFEERLRSITDPERYAGGIYRKEILGETKEEDAAVERFFNNYRKKHPSFSTKQKKGTSTYAQTKVQHRISSGDSDREKDQPPRTRQKSEDI